MATFRNLVAGSGVLAIGAVAFFSGTTMHADAVATPTFTKDVAPIIQQKCETCHRAEGIMHRHACDVLVSRLDPLSTEEIGNPFRSTDRCVLLRQVPPSRSRFEAGNIMPSASLRQFTRRTNGGTLQMIEQKL